MNAEELYESFYALVPVKRYDSDPEDADFRKVINRAFTDYMTLMEVMRYDNLVSDDNIKEVKKTCDRLRAIVKSEYMGLHSTAFTQLSNLIKGGGNQPALSHSILLYNLKANEKPLYRMRKIEDRRHLIYTDMFHIPLNKRGVVSTNRFSAPGYPCLYLGTSIYACWEELGRPPMSQSMVSRFGNDFDLKLIDLRIPTLEKFRNNIISYIRAFPLIIACSIRVKDESAHYKPEYCIPQLLMEFVISHNVSHNKNDKVAGVYYTSVFKNYDFDYPLDKLENIAIPVQEPLSSHKFCRRLSYIFRLSKPTCDEMEQLRTAGYNTIEHDDENGIDVFHQGVVDKYEYSSFGRLEERLNDCRLFPLLPIEDKQVKREEDIKPITSANPH